MGASDVITTYLQKQLFDGMTSLLPTKKQVSVDMM